MASAPSRTAKDRRVGPSTSSHAAGADVPLRVNEAGIDLLCERLRAANQDNPEFAPQSDRLLGAVRQALDGLLRHFPDEIERVLARGAWAFDGIDLRELRESEDVLLEIIVRREERDFSLERRISRDVVHELHIAFGREFLLQFSTLPLPLWLRAEEQARAHGQDLASSGIPLLTRV